MSQTWIWIIVAIPVIFSWYGAYQQLLLRKPFGNNLAPDWIMFFLLVFGIFSRYFLPHKTGDTVRITMHFLNVKPVMDASVKQKIQYFSDLILLRKKF